MVEGCRAVSFLRNLHLQMFKLLARAYADVHPMMMDRSENRCGGNFLKQGSIINGADWYSFTGGASAGWVDGWVGPSSTELGSGLSFPYHLPGEAGLGGAGPVTGSHCEVDLIITCVVIPLMTKPLLLGKGRIGLYTQWQSPQRS